MPRLEKGEHAPLNVTQKGQHRIYAGLGWDPHVNANIMEKLGAMVGIKKTYHDLDLSCLLFDAHKNPLPDIAIGPARHVDQSGHIYHSGDSIAGVGDGDDEQLSVELRDVTSSIHYLMFVASIKSGHTFGEVVSPEIRLADGYSNHNFLQAPLTHPEGRLKSAFAFASIYRQGDGWNVHNISTYLDLSAVQKPNGVLKSLLVKS